MTIFRGSAADPAHVAAPPWFTTACAQPCGTGDVEVAGARVRYLVWDRRGPAEEAPLLLLHGTAAHAQWWTHVAGILAADRRVVALDFSGHGDSAHRRAYSVDVWADEVLAAAAVADPDGTGIGIVGHSLGGIVAPVAVTRADRPVLGLALCETIRDPRGPYDEVVTAKPRRHFSTFDEAIARFRLVPSQPGSLPFVLDRIARCSVVEYPDGWSWKYDTQLVDGLREVLPTADDVLPSVPCPLAFVRSERGLMSRDEVRAMAAAYGRPAPTVELPAAGHHPMLDQPLALVVAIRALFSRSREWR